MILQVEGLSKSFRRGSAWSGRGEQVRAVQGASFDLNEGETLAIVGESGSGKSTTARLVMRLLDPDSGEIQLSGNNIAGLSGADLRAMRKQVQMVFQDPFASLNPRMKIVDTVGEGLRVHAPELSKQQRRQKVIETLSLCGLGEEVLERYPHQFSGGQRQRIGIARALAVMPKVLVLDEPVSALDVSVQAQILNLLTELQSRLGLAYLFISHDLSVVRRFADRVAVMFAGRIVEEGPIEEVYGSPKHPYTLELMKARPIAHPDERSTELAAPPEQEEVAESGCLYRLRCPFAQSACAEMTYEVLSPGREHRASCLFPQS